MADRTFGWVQEAYTITNLKKVVSVFVPDSDVNILLRNDKIPRLVSETYNRNDMLFHLEQKDMKIPYTLLKGRGTPRGFTRSNAPCSGIIQAVLKGQRREYQSDWPADSFLRWAVSIGFLGYDREDDTCFLTDFGCRYAMSENDSDEEAKILTEAFLSYPPVCRILNLLSNNMHMTKFEIGCRLGFVGEAGFTSIPQYLILQGLSEAENTDERAKLLQDTEGTSDKYVRTICSWLKDMGGVKQEPKEITETIGSKSYTDTIGQAYILTLEGRKILKHIQGSSKFKKIPKRVMWDMLATKPADRNYLRNRRAYIIKYISSAYRSIGDIINYLGKKGISEENDTIKDDIEGLKNIGLTVDKNGERYKIKDKITYLEIPSELSVTSTTKSDVTVIKDKLRKQLTHIDHKYLILIDLGFDGTADRDYEIQTADLLTKELDFKGTRLGSSRKPDVCVYYKSNGLIIDNKAYSRGYSLPIQQADEMFRYIEENQKRDKNINPNEWWKIFDNSVIDFNFVFVSGSFTGGFKERLQNIYNRSGVKGAAINSVNLLLLAESIKSDKISYSEAIELFDCLEEISIQN